MINKNFLWVKFYTAFADKLLDFENDRKTLLDKLIKVYDNLGMKFQKLERDDAIIDIDPFTVFGMFNKGITRANKITIIKAFAKEFDIKESIESPTVFDGIPILNNLMAVFFGWDRPDTDIDNLWLLFRTALNYADATNKYELQNAFIDVYDKVVKQSGIKWNITMGLYWIRPYTFLNLDSRNRWFIQHNCSDLIDGNIKALKKVPDGKTYLSLCELTTTKLTAGEYSYKNLPELSYAAYIESERVNQENKKMPKEDSAMAEILTNDIDDGWFPKDYSPELSVDDWIGLLNDKDIFTPSSLEIMRRLKDYGGSATCKQLSQKYGETANFYNSGSSALARRIAKKTGCPTISTDTQNSRWWPILYLGKYAHNDEEGNFVWKLRPELSQALDNIDLSYIQLFTKTNLFQDNLKKHNKNNKADKNLTEEDSVMVEEDKNAVHYWLYAAGHGSEKWEDFYNKGIMAIGWGEIGDLSRFEDKNQIKEAMKQVYMQPDRSFKNDAHATWQFANEMKVGDVIFVKRGASQIVGRGVVDSDYIYDETQPGDYDNVRKVKWTHKGEWNHPGQAALKTLTDITQYTEYVEKLNNLFATEEDIELDEKEIVYPTYTAEDFLNDVYMSERDYTTLVELLAEKKNVILQGAPGVGKTFAARRLAYSVMGIQDFERVMMVQFHQSYSYEDFIRGYRPTENGGFVLKKGPFYNFCKKAENDSDNDYFFIIDEINRGNLSKIFGELFMLVEKDKRSKVKLQLLYSDEKFSVPENLYIIGMMNTADRSLAMLDYALRRRFAFFDMKPGFETDRFIEYRMKLNDPKFDKLINAIESLNNAIASDDSLGEGFKIGHSYFCNLKKVDNNRLANIVEYELIPMIKEYWFDEPSKVKDWSNILRSAIK